MFAFYAEQPPSVRAGCQGNKPSAEAKNTDGRESFMGLSADN